MARSRKTSFDERLHDDQQSRPEAYETSEKEGTALEGATIKDARTRSRPRVESRGVGMWLIREIQWARAAKLGVQASDRREAWEAASELFQACRTAYITSLSVLAANTAPSHSITVTTSSLLPLENQDLIRIYITQPRNMSGYDRALSGTNVHIIAVQSHLNKTDFLQSLQSRWTRFPSRICSGSREAWYMRGGCQGQERGRAGM